MMRYVRSMTSRSLTRAARIAQSGRIDPQAPVWARAAIEVSAPATVVWRVLSDLRQWPEVLPGVSRVRLPEPGDLQPGTRFAWRNQGFPLRSVVQRVHPDEELTWTGQALWLVAIHRNTIKPTASGCGLVSEESMTGWGAVHLMPSKKLEEQLGGFIQAIAHEAERRHDRG